MVLGVWGLKGFRVVWKFGDVRRLRARLFGFEVLEGFTRQGFGTFYIFPLLGLRGSYLLIFLKAFKAPPSLGSFRDCSYAVLRKASS